MPLHHYSEQEQSRFMLLPDVTPSPNQSPSKDFYSRPPLTLPNRTLPLLPQFDAFLNASAHATKHYGAPTYGGPYGKLGISRHPEIKEIKQLLAELPPSISLEARGVFLTTLLDKFHPTLLGSDDNLPPFYDYPRDNHLAKRVYGGNGLYKALEEWIALARGKLPGIPQKIKLPWLAMHIRHTLLHNPQAAETHNDVQTAIDMILHFKPHYRKPSEHEGDYIDRMSGPYWQAHLALGTFNLLPNQQNAPIASIPLRRY